MQLRCQPGYSLEAFCRRGKLYAAGRNGQASSAVNKSDLSIRTTSKEMKKYCVQQQMCRRSILCSYFDCSTAQVIGCACCDIYSKNCECTDCKCKSFPVQLS